MDGEALQGIADNYGGVKVNLTEPLTIEEFVPKLRTSLVEWKNQGKKGIWLKLADGLDNLIAPAKAQGFVCHHAEKEYTMLTSWISELPSTIPDNASHRIGVGAFVLNKKTREVLVVQEIDGHFKGTGVWKLPTGVVQEVNLTEPLTIEEFVPKLRTSLVEWKNQGKKGIWLKLADGLDNLIAPAKAQGFVCHHAEKEYTMLTSWISELPSTIPDNASHRIGVGAFVLNKKTREVLVVQEIDGHFKGTGVWKLPTGVVQEGENIWEGAVREAEEETGIKTKFVEVLAFRESHQAFLERKTDIFFLCELEPTTFEIKIQDSEILAAKWMPVEEYVNQPWNQKKELFRFMANICLKRSQETKYVGFSKVLTTTSSGKESYLYSNTDYANLLNPSRGLASTSTPASTSR